MPLLVKDSNGQSTTVPSYVYFHPEGRVYVGQAALQQASLPKAIPQNLISAYKKLLGYRYVYFLMGEMFTYIRMSEKIDNGALVKLLQKIGTMKIIGVGKAKDRIRYVILVKNKAGSLEEKYVTPTECVRHMILYLLCQYIKDTKEAVEFLVTTVPGMQTFDLF